LCLHGYRQSGAVFKQKLGALRKALKKHAELFFVTAPNKILSAEDTLLSVDDAQKNGMICRLTVNTE
jgi:Serine hydrolase (FSH1).